MTGRDRPNVVLVFTDDQGYGDLGCFGSPYIDTPNVDQMADEGARFTDFQAAPVCTPSRTALMTGSYAARVGLADGVLFPGDDEGLHSEEVTIADVLSEAGYASCIGKWHLGDHHPFLPTDHGFDSYFGTPTATICSRTTTTEGTATRRFRSYATTRWSSPSPTSPD